MESEFKKVGINEIDISTGVNSNVDRDVTKVIHEYIELKCFYEGNSTLIVGENRVEVKAGDVVVINPYEFHSTIDSGVEKGKYHLFMVSLDYFSGSKEEKLDLRNLFFVQKKVFNNLYKNDKELSDILKSAAEEYDKKDAAYQIAIRGILMHFFVVLLRKNIHNKEEYNISAKSVYSYKTIEPALRHIRDNYDQGITVDELSKLCGLSKFYFCHNFKEVTGKSAMEYLRDYRITTADVILTHTEESIEKIAKNCGFESANYFYRCYKKHYGEPPTKRRKNLKIK